MKVEAGVTFPKGFMAQGVGCCIKKSNVLDLALLYSQVPCQAAGVFTTNKVQAACIKVNRELLEDGTARAIVINSGNANACTGEQGLQDAYEMGEIAAQQLKINREDVLVASTGVIGVPLPMERVKEGIIMAAGSLSADGGHNACKAIMTTDTMPKEMTLEVNIGGVPVRIGGMAKGSGMIHPNMATMLAFITTDAKISSSCLQKALRDSTAVSYNMISVDGDTSTNDMALVMANGMAGNREIDDENMPEYQVFKEALNQVNTFLAQAIARDGEGATRLIEVTVTGAVNDLEARKAARAVTASNLFKTAVFGQDANWGRIICAAGYSEAEFKPELTDIYLGNQQVAVNGMGIPFDEEQARKDLCEEVVRVKLDLKQGQGKATAWGCDLSYDYIKINASYRS